MIAFAGLLSGLFTGAANDILDVIASALNAALTPILKFAATFWVSIPTPNLAATAGGSTPSQPVDYLQSHLHYFIAAAVAFSVLVGLGKMAWEQRFGGSGAELLKGMLTFIAVSGAGLTVISLLVSVSDSFSTWILADALNITSTAKLGTAFAAKMALVFPASGAAVWGGAVMLYIILVIFGLLASIIQCFLMIVRGGMLVILTGVLPLCFAFWTTDAGKQWSKKASAWLIAFTLYKPAAAIVYATAFQLMSSAQGDAMLNVFTGMTLMFLAVLALPALMRFVSPMTAGIAGGGAGMMLGAAAGIAAAGMLPTGSLSAMGAGAGAGAGGTGAAGAPGASGSLSSVGAGAGSGGGMGPAGGGADGGGTTGGSGDSGVFGSSLNSNLTGAAVGSAVGGGLSNSVPSEAGDQA